MHGRFVAGVLLIALSIGLAGCDHHADQTQPANGPADHKIVHVAAAQQLDRAQTYTLTGTTRAASRAQLSFQVSGTLAARAVDLGSTVSKGELLARLSQPELKPAAAAAAAHVRQLSNELAQARRDLSRVQTLVSKDAATRQELDDARARRDNLVSGLSRARAESQRASNSAGELTLKAPIAGTVDRVLFERGEFVPAGQPVIALSGAHQLEVKIGVPEQLIGTLSIGQAARLSLPFFNNRQLQGTVTRVSAAAGGEGQLFKVVISLAGADGLRPGLSLEWHVQGARQQGLLVPADAVASPGASSQARVYVVRDGIVHTVAVTLGELVGDQVRIQGALQVGDRVVTAGLNNLSDGRAVSVAGVSSRDTRPDSSGGPSGGPSGE